MKRSDKIDLNGKVESLNDALIFGNSYKLDDGNIVIYRSDAVIFELESPSVDQCQMVDESRLTRR